jgi:zinc transport system substrate-binding protein
VVVSVPPQAFFVRKLAGEQVRVEVLIPPGANPVSYEPGFSQLGAMADASLLVKVGHPQFPFERARLAALLAINPGVPVVDTSAGIDASPGDPHVWVSPANARTIARNLAGALARTLPDHANGVEANLRAFLGEIDALDREILELLAARRGAKFLVFHPAWGYFAEEYGLVQVAIERDHKEPDARQLAELIETARREELTLVFVQPQFDSASAALVATEIGGRVEPLDPLAYDWSTNLRHVAERIAAGTAP